MAIELRVEEYCNNCDEFEPCVKFSYYCYDYVNRIVQCVHSDRCEEIAESIRKENIKNDKSRT